MKGAMPTAVCRKTYSFRSDSTVPRFDDGGFVVFMDGDCVLSTTGALARLVE